MWIIRLYTVETLVDFYLYNFFSKYVINNCLLLIYTPFKLSWVCSLDDFILYDNMHYIVWYSSIYRFVVVFLYRYLIYIILLKTRPENLLRNIIIFYSFQTPKSKYTWVPVPTRSLDNGINALSRIKKSYLFTSDK